MFRIKICGLTSVDDALEAAAGGADAIGLNFFAQSKRCVDVETARHISLALPAEVKRVGVFVNASTNDIGAVLREVGLDAIQLHGDEPAELLAELPRGIPVVRAYRCGQQGLLELASYLSACRAHGRLPDAILVDADVGADFGGSGKLADWSVVARDRDYLNGIPLILAGGLSVANVGAAIAAVQPDGVDVASGVERSPGCKDAKLVRDFIAAARAAFSDF